MHLLPRFETPISEETLLKSGKGIPGTKEISEILGIKENKEAQIHRLDLPYRKTMLTMERK